MRQILYYEYKYVHHNKLREDGIFDSLNNEFKNLVMCKTWSEHSKLHCKHDKYKAQILAAGLNTRFDSERTEHGCGTQPGRDGFYDRPAQRDSLGADSGAHQRRADTVSEANVPGSGEASLFFYGEPCAEQIVPTVSRNF